MYSVIRNALFLLDAERAHYLSMNALKLLCSIAPIKWAISKAFSPKGQSLEKQLFGLSFKNPVGLGAGFDKNAAYLRELEALGFGFVEIGTVTPLPQEGNEKPRLFRLPEDMALINRMGFNNDGVKVIRERLEKWGKKTTPHLPTGRQARSRRAGLGAPPEQVYQPLVGGEFGKQPVIQGKMIIGGNIGKNKVTPNEDAWKDYEICFNELFDVVDYFVVNVSSPNTPGLRALQDKDSLLKILGTLQQNNKQRPVQKPILLKIAPDLTDGQLQDIAALAEEIQLDGIVSSNTTISREKLSDVSKTLAEKMGMGGLSGKPLKSASDEILKKIITLTNGKVPVIASGGIFTAGDAQDKFNHGAALVQVWTGFIYEGPGIVKKICKGLK
jgi:dihydroorotate dehydrogenase